MTNPKWNATNTNPNNHSYEDYNACILLNNYGIYLMEIGSLKESIEIFRSTIDCFNTILLNEKQQQQEQEQEEQEQEEQDQKQEHQREQQYTPNNDASRQRNRNTTTLGNNNGYNSCHNMNSDDSDKSDNGSNTTARIVAKRLLPSEFREQCILNPPHTGMESSSSSATATSSYDKEKDSTSSTNEDPRASTFSCCCCCCCSSSNVCQSSSNDRILIDSPVRIHCGYENCTCQHRITIDPTIGCAIALYNFGLAHVGLLQCLQQEQQVQQQQQQEQSQAVHCNNNKQTCQLIAMITRLLLLSNSLIESIMQKIRTCIGNDRKNHGNNNNIRGLVLFSFTIQCVLARVRQQQSMINETKTENNHNSSNNDNNNNNNNNNNTALDLELRTKVSLLYIYLSKEENGFVENNEFTIDFIATVA